MILLRALTPKKKLDKLEADIVVTKNANLLLSSHLVESEIQCWGHSRYSGKETFDIVGLPKSFKNDEAETKLYQIFQSLDYNVIKKIWVLAIGFRIMSELL